MSNNYSQEINCPECGNLQAATIWTSVNVTLEPEMRDVTLDRRLNVFCCEKCGHMASLDVSVMYHDMNRRYAIQYVNRQDMKNPDYYQSIRNDGTLSMPPMATGMAAKFGGDYLARPHFVFSMNELICYIAFRDLCEAWGKDES